MTQERLEYLIGLIDQDQVPLDIKFDDWLGEVIHAIDELGEEVARLAPLEDQIEIYMEEAIKDQTEMQKLRDRNYQLQKDLELALQAKIMAETALQAVQQPLPKS
jgi:phage terminase small subunit